MGGYHPVPYMDPTEARPASRPRSQPPIHLALLALVAIALVVGAAWKIRSIVSPPRRVVLHVVAGAEPVSVDAKGRTSLGTVLPNKSKRFELPGGRVTRVELQVVGRDPIRCDVAEGLWVGSALGGVATWQELDYPEKGSAWVAAAPPRSIPPGCERMSDDERRAVIAVEDEPPLVVEAPGVEEPAGFPVRRFRLQNAATGLRGDHDEVRQPVGIQ